MEEQKENFFDFRDTILEGGVLDIGGNKARREEEKSRRAMLEQRTGLSYKDLVKLGIRNGASSSDSASAANKGYQTFMQGSMVRDPATRNKFNELTAPQSVQDYVKSIEQRDKNKIESEKNLDALRIKKEKEKAEAEAEAEYRNSFKGRLDTLWEDGSKRNAILSGISETLLETRTGADAYGNRFRDLPKNVNDKMMQAEALDMVKDQAMLDMIKTQAETQAAMDPRQFLTNTQKNASDFASAKGHVIGSKEWNAAYAGAIQEMTMENLLTAPIEGIAAINELLARNTGMFDQPTIDLFKGVIETLTSKIQGEPMGKSRSDKVVIQGGTD